MVWHELDEFTELQQKGTIGIKKYQLIYRVFFISRHFGRNTSSVIRQKGKFQNVCVSEGKKCSGFFGKFGVLCFVETLVLRFALLPYYRRLKPIFKQFFNLILYNATEL